ncbi:hypothetical protein ACMDCR_03260 [Labrys okinawensis]|uniref:hypothetical protein n=1 Tax=Labrys okinawensis TaxID=346911 RepID=UPI0039BC238A
MLVGGVIIADIGVRFPERLAHPVVDKAFHLPVARGIDRPLILGAALASLSLGLWQTILFVLL